VTNHLVSSEHPVLVSDWTSALEKKIGHVRLLKLGGRPIFDGGRGGSNARRFCSLSQLSILRRAAPAACAFVPVNLAVVDFPSALSG
jgi:hypothetical protein